MASEKFSLILGCGGYRYNKLTLCSGTYNVIIDFNRHFDPNDLEKVMDFLDFTCGLFDGPIGDWNKITNTLKFLYDRFKLIDDKMWEALHVWLPHHKRCGAVLRLVVNEEIPILFAQTQEHLIKPEHLKS